LAEIFLKIFFQQKTIKKTFKIRPVKKNKTCVIEIIILVKNNGVRCNTSKINNYRR